MNRDLLAPERKRDWQAEWIWHGDEPAPFHYHLFIRKTFRVAGKPDSAAVCITATDRYRLLVNGRYLGRGPSRCDPRWQSFDTHDISELLTEGMNTVAVHAYFYGCPTGFTRDGLAGMKAQIELCEAGKLRIIGTGPDWKVRPGRGWRRDAKAANSGVGVTEVYDARLDPPDWTANDFDDADWEPATVIPAGRGAWCGAMEKREIPPLGEEEQFPERILEVGETLSLQDTSGAVDIPEILAQEPHLRLQVARVENAEAALRPDEGAATVAPSSPAVGEEAGEGVREPYILFDFGRQLNAFPRICIHGAAGGIVDLTYGEQLIGGRVVPLISGTRIGDRYIMRDGDQTFETFDGIVSKPRNRTFTI